MPTNENANQQNEVKRNLESSSRKPSRKAPGTRVGTLQDWRGANNSGKITGRHGQSIRDGR
jgi:hypothetical protein